MLKKTMSVVVLSTLAFGSLFLAGCASGRSEPYALTGRPEAKEAAKRYEWVHRYGDSKGVYRMGNPVAAVPAERP
jgi:hypothetical protein